MHFRSLRLFLVCWILLMAEPGEAGGGAELALNQSTNTSSSSLIYVNRCTAGCSINPGIDNAVERTSSIINQPRLLTEFAYDETTFGGVVACLNSVLAQYNVRLTSTDPGNTIRREIVLAGTSEQLGLTTGLTGIAPYTASPIENVLVFAFANSTGGNVDLMCAVAANQLTHVYGLDNEFSCPDLTSYLTGCGVKSFTDVDAPCGEFSVRQCGNGNATQNSHATLSAVIGVDDRVHFGNFDSPRPIFP